jgi:aspartate/methionine/tyrosine aminotransferase
VSRAREFLRGIPGGLGAYSDSAGAAVLRRHIAAALEKRDGVPADPDELYLTVRGGGGGAPPPGRVARGGGGGGGAGGGGGG